MKKIILYIGFAMTTVIFTSCEEDRAPELPNDGDIAYVNFYNASEAPRFGGQLFLGEENMIYINDSVPTPVFPEYPMFSPNVSDDARQYPYHFTGTDAVFDNAGGEQQGVIYRKTFWMPLATGNYAFTYTSRYKVFLETIQATLERKKYYTQYLVESPAADSLYTVIQREVPRAGIEGKVIVQIVHLSPDLGPIDIYHTDIDGGIITSSLPSDYTFGQTELYELSTENSEATYNKILLKFKRPGDAGPIQSVAVPAVSGSVFTVVLQGFTQETERRIKIGESEYATVTVLPDLRINLRRMFF